MQTLINILIGLFAVIGFCFCCGIAFVVLLGSEIRDDKNVNKW